MKLANQLRQTFRAVCIRLVLNSQRYSLQLLFVVGSLLLVGGLMELSTAQGGINPAEPAYAQPAEAAFGRPGEAAIGRPAQPAFARPAQATDVPYNDSLSRCATGNLYRLIEGAFGALVMVVAGLAAIIAAAMGAYKMAISLVFIAVGAFILRALVSLFFGTNYPACESDGTFIVPFIP